MSHTHTVVFLQVSERTFEEIHQKLKDAAYTHTFFTDRERGLAIDMSGIALCRPDPPPKKGMMVSDVRKQEAYDARLAKVLTHIAAAVRGKKK